MSANPQSRPPGEDPGPEPATGADDQDETGAAQAPDDPPGDDKPFTAPEGYELI
jgi:hypothetical protein